MVIGAVAKSGKFIRFPDERWNHICEEHAELLDMRPNILQTIADPLRILAGKAGELLAVSEVEAGKYLVVVYKELDEDGFVITAFVTRRVTQLAKREHLWP